MDTIIEPPFPRQFFPDNRDTSSSVSCFVAGMHSVQTSEEDSD